VTLLLELALSVLGALLGVVARPPRVVTSLLRLPRAFLDAALHVVLAAGRQPQGGRGWRPGRRSGR
jgi:hypothetical protein